MQAQRHVHEDSSRVVPVPQHNDQCQRGLSSWVASTTDSSENVLVLLPICIGPAAGLRIDMSVVVVIVVSESSKASFSRNTSQTCETGSCFSRESSRKPWSWHVRGAGPCREHCLRSMSPVKLPFSYLDLGSGLEPRILRRLPPSESPGRNGRKHRHIIAAQ